MGLQGRTCLWWSLHRPFHFETQGHYFNSSSHCWQKICFESNSFRLWLSGITELSCNVEEVKCSQSDARSRPGQARKLGGCSRGSAACNQAPSCQLLTPHTARCSPFHTEEKHKWNTPPPPPPARVCASASGLFFSPLSILSKLTATKSQPLGTAVGLISKTGQSLYTNPQPHTLALALRCGERNLLSLCLTHNHPSITDTEGATIDTVCKHHCLAAATLKWPPKDETEKDGVKTYMEEEQKKSFIYDALSKGRGRKFHIKR